MTLNATQWTAIGPAPVDTPNVSLGHSAGRVEVAAPDPTDTDTMYLGANGGGVWKTGVWTTPTPVWLSLSDDQPSLNFAGYHPLVVHPAQPALVLGVVSGPGAGILKSTNGGVSWTLLANGTFEGASLGSIAVHPTNTSIMYVSVWVGGAVASPGVWQSTDGGVTWTNTTAFHAGFVTDVVIAKWDANVLYAGLVATPNQGGVGTSGVYRSPDQGQTWKLLPGLPSNLFLGSAVRIESSTASGTAYVALFYANINSPVTVVRYKTADDGVSWTPLAATPGTPELRSWHLVLAVDPTNPAHVVVNDAYSLYESADSGKTWASAEKIGDDWVNIAFDARNNMVATADRNVYSRSFDTKTWTSKQGNLQITQLFDLALDQGNLSAAYGVAQDHTAAMRFSGTNEWTNMPGGTGETGRVLIDPTQSSRLYASNPLDPANLVFRSTDAGATWTTIANNGSFTSGNYGLAYATQKSFAMDAQQSKRLLIGLTTVFECTDATVANPVWKQISPVLSPSSVVGGQYITALAIAPTNGSVVYAATADGHVWWTINDGQQWKQNDSGLFGPGAGAVIDMRIDPSNVGQVYAVTNGGAGQNIWHRDPATGKWSAITGDMPKNLSMASICADWPTPIVLYVGTNRGVYRSTGSPLGAHWSIAAIDLPRTVATDLQTIPGSNVLAAATFGRGVWEILLSKKFGLAAEAEPAADAAPPAEPRPVPASGTYSHLSDLTILPGRLPGQPLAPRNGS